MTKKIAIEEHFGTPELMQLRLDWFKRDGLPMTLPESEVRRATAVVCDVEQRLREMDRLGIEKQVLMPSSNGIEGILDPREALEACRRFNKVLAETVKAHPDRFSAFGAIPFQDAKLAVEELERCMGEYGFIGSWLSGYIHKRGFIDEPQFRPVFAAADRLGAHFYLHPTETPLSCAGLYEGHPALVGPPWSWGVDTATYVLRIILSGLLDEYPGTSIFLGHMGEMLPFIIWRLENRLGIMPGSRKLKLPIREYFRRNIAISTSGNLADAALRCAIDAFGADRVLFSIDYPFEAMEPACTFLEEAKISEEERRMICYENAERLLGV